MNMLKIGFVIFLLSCLILMNCSKYQETVLKPRLLITLKDESGNSVRGATVRLYKNAQDTGITQLSDTTGIVLFENLEPVLYFWDAEKGCKTNRISQHTLNRPLIEDVVLYGYSVMSETGTLKIDNTSIEPYKVTDSLFNITVYKDTPYIAHRKIGSYTIRSSKLSTPGIVKDSLIQIRCSDTTILHLPY
jgi:hypothetical protein